MKKTIVKSAKSIIIAVAVCASLALGALSIASGSAEGPVVACDPEFIFDVY